MNSILGFTTGQQFSLAQIVINLLLALCRSLLIAWVYRRTHKGVAFSQTFVFTLVLMCLLVAMIMMVIGNNLARAFTLLGAFSIIRFRTAVKDTKDTGFIFFVLCAGMAIGTNAYTLAIVGTLFILAVILLLQKVNFGTMRKHEYILSFVVNYNQNNSEDYEDIFRLYFKHTLLLNINSKQEGKAAEITYFVSFIDDNKKGKFVQEFSVYKGIEKVHLITSTEDVEY